MRRLLLSATALCFLIPLDATAQSYSAEEQEVIDFTEGCWEMWAEEQVDGYLSDCWHEDISFWWPGLILPFGTDWVSKIAPYWFSMNDWGAWDIMPVVVKIYGDAAVIQYQLVLASSPSGGEPALETWGEARSDFLVRFDGGWKVVAVHTHEAEQNPGS